MTSPARFRIDPAALAALRTSLRVWLLGMLRWLLGAAEPLLPRAIKLEIRTELAGARAEVLDLIGQMALARLRAVRRTGLKGPPAWSDPHRSRICPRRALTRGLIGRAHTLRDRIDLLLAALRDLDALALRFVARLVIGAKGAWVVIEGPRHREDGLASATPAARDTS